MIEDDMKFLPVTMMGLGITPIPARESRLVVAKTRIDFWPRRLIIPDAIARLVLIKDIRFNGKSQLLNTLGIPGDMFSEKVGDLGLKLPKIGDRDHVEIEVVNCGVKFDRIVFRGAIIGQIDFQVMANEKLPAATPEGPAYPILKLTIDEIECSVRCYGAFVKMGVKTIGELVQKTPSDVLDRKNAGKKTLDEIRRLLAPFGLFLKDDQFNRYMMTP